MNFKATDLYFKPIFDNKFRKSLNDEYPQAQQIKWQSSKTSKNQIQWENEYSLLDWIMQIMICVTNMKHIMLIIQDFFQIIEVMQKAVSTFIWWDNKAISHKRLPLFEFSVKIFAF